MALFQHEDFIFLGMMWASYFQGYLYNWGDGQFGGGNWSGGGGGWIPDQLPKYGTGRGGIINGMVFADGDDGRPGASDAATGPVEPSLAGGKGTLTSPGAGVNDGGFGYGGRAQLTADGYNISAGGGSGWFGGGAAFIDAGGGGGSNYCLADDIISLEGRSNIKEYQPPYWFKPGLWVGVDIQTAQHYINNLELYTTNTRHISEYNGMKSSLGEAYQAFIDLHIRANGNGLCLISRPNTMITINRIDGTIDNIDTIVEYTGKEFSWTPPIEADYHFILWGAQGGTVNYEPPSASLYQSYTGGFGGAVSGIFNLAPTHKEIQPTGEEIDVDTVIGIYVGQAGNQVRGYNTYNGGGNAGGGGSTSGGGATDLRWSLVGGWKGNLYDRFLVAGGGGGCIGANFGNPPVEPITPGGGGNSIIEGDKDKGEIKIPDDEPIMFLVNDRSLVYVTITYYTPSLLPDNTSLSCTLYINNGNEGVLYQKFEAKPVGGIIELVYELDQVYPPNTPTHLVGLSVTIQTNVMFIIPSNGVNIRVETRAGVNEPNSDWENKEPPIIKSNNLVLSLLSSIKAVLTSPPEDEYLRFKTALTLLSEIKTSIKEIEKVFIRLTTPLDLINSNKLDIRDIPTPGDKLIRLNSTLDLISSIGIKLENIQEDSLKDTNRLSLDSRVKAVLRDIDQVKMNMQTNLEMINIIKEEDTNG